MQRLKIALPDDLRAQLDAASKKIGESVAEQVRRRLETSFTQEAVDKPTRDLLEAIMRITAEITRERGASWARHRGAFEVLIRAIQIWLAELKPAAGPTAFDPNWPHATVPTDDPHQLASLIVHRLRKEPGFTHSKTREWMEEEHQRLRLGPPPPPWEKMGQKPPETVVGSASSQQYKKDEGQQKLDQPKKRRK